MVYLIFAQIPKVHYLHFNKKKNSNLVTNAFFKGNRKDNEQEREEMWKRQQEILEERRSGSRESLNKAYERRQEIQKKEDAKKQKKINQREALARGEKFVDEDWKEPYEDEEEGGIIIPINPIGIPKYDQGERFDLKLPYVDEGWVDEDADPFKWIKNIFGKKQEKINLKDKEINSEEEENMNKD